jgi:hypothetical protein
MIYNGYRFFINYLATDVNRNLQGLRGREGRAGDKKNLPQRHREHRVTQRRNKYLCLGLAKG